MTPLLDFLSQTLSFIGGPFSSLWFFGNFLNKASLYMFAGTGAALALKSGNFNLGGEAQIYAPALVTALILSQRRAFEASGFTLFVCISCAFVCAVCTGAVLAGIPGLLKARRGTSELLTSFLLSAALIPVIDFLIAGPLRDSGKNLLATKAIAPFFRLKSLLPPSYFTLSFFIAIALSIGVYFFLHYTKAGFSLTITGKTFEFAKYAGFKVQSFNLWGMAASGAFHGLTGFFAITGTWYMCHQGFSSGMGWGALAIALIARAHPLYIIPSAIMYALIENASDIYVLSTSQSFDTTALLQGLIFLFITAKLIRSRS